VLISFGLRVLGDYVQLQDHSRRVSVLVLRQLLHIQQLLYGLV
jgi:hypothetical protein